MIPREILKKIRQIEIRTNRIVTEALDLARFLVSAGRRRVLEAKSKALRPIFCVFKAKTDTHLSLNYVVLPQTVVCLRQNYIILSLGYVHLRLRHVASRLGDVRFLQNHIGLWQGYIREQQRNIHERLGQLALSEGDIAGRLNRVRFAPSIPDLSFV